MYIEISCLSTYSFKELVLNYHLRSVKNKELNLWSDIINVDSVKSAQSTFFYAIIILKGYGINEKYNENARRKRGDS